MIDETMTDALNALVGAWEEVSSTQQLSSSACILATRAACEALAYFDIKAIPMPVSMAVQNALLVAQLDAEYEPDWDSGAWGVGINPDIELPPEAEGWNGHLVAHLVEHDTFIDLTLSQFARPQKDIHVRPLIAGFGQEFLDGLAGSYHMNGCRVWYQYRPELTSWKHTPDGRRNVAPFAGPMIRKLKPILK